MKVVKNIISLFLGQGTLLILNFLIILLAARYLGVETFGEFSSILAIVTIISKFIDFGLGPIVFRELSKNNSDYQVLSKALSLKIILLVTSLLISNAIFILIDLPMLQVVLINMLAINILISSKMANFRELLTVPFKSNFDMHIPMIINAIDYSILLLLVLFIPQVDDKLNFFIFSYVIANIPGFVLIIIVLKLKYNFKFNFILHNSKELVRQSLPLAGFVLMMVLFSQIDIILLKSLRNSFDAGIFSAASRLTMPLNIIPITLVTSVFPILIKNLTSEEKKKEIILIIFKALFLISFSIAVLFSFKSNDIIHLFFGKDYMLAVEPAVYLFWMQVFLFFNFFSLDVFTAHEKQKFNLIYAVIIFSVNLILDIILIPQFSFYGPALAKIIAAAIGTIYIIMILRKLDIQFYFIRYNIIVYSLLFFIVSFLGSGINVILYLIFSPIISVIFIVLTKSFSNAELKMVLKAFNLEKYRSWLLID